MIATRFSVALHILLLVADDSAGDSTSARLAWSIGTNPVVVRRIAGQLSRAGLISVQRGPGGASLSRPASQITLRDVWRAIHPEKEKLLGIHQKTNAECPVGRHVPALLRQRFDAAEMVLLQDLDTTTIAQLAEGLRQGTPMRAAG
ncbi:Rrf2 family transcriptional regulator [Roseicella frigidaeris]|uniref:Transcriptional regulator n=1 Tax=Roseicella frigidaeris TaxID=2230885 RepID=A0A327MAH7_9PROT|nr:Rrf2 family transcriptional regulator [Roseicella frigidaeris]RAI59456.1 transcriptional regulator [Roseicella frigidaeris]